MNTTNGTGLFDGIPGYDKILILLGIVLFVMLAFAFVLLLLTKKGKVTVLLPFFLLPIIMIGFPSIKSFKGGGIEVDVQTLQEKTTTVENNPNDEAARSNLQAAVQKAQTLVTTNDASAEVAEGIARGNAALGNTDRAVEWASVAVKKAPDSEAAKMLLARTRVLKYLPPDLGKPITPQAHSNLVVAVNDL